MGQLVMPWLLLLVSLTGMAVSTHGSVVVLHTDCESPPCLPEGVGPECPELGQVTTMLSQLVDHIQTNGPRVERVIGKVGDLVDKLDGLQRQLDELKQNVTVPEAYRPTYRIFHFESPLGSYRLTLDGARELCTSKNMDLATVTQLEAAYRQGLNLCSCGWLADGTARYAIQYPEDWCGGHQREAGIVFCEWQSTWNAYCFNSRSKWEENSNDNQ